MTKKILSYVLVLVMGISLVGNVYLIIKQNEYLKLVEQSKKEYPKIYDILNSITISSFDEKIKSKERVIVYVGRPDCSDCSAFEPRFIDYLNNINSKDLIYLNVSSIRSDEKKWDDFVNTFGIKYTPTIALFEEGELVDKVEWTPETGINLKEVEKFLDKYIID